MRGMVIFIKQKVRAFAVCLIGLSAIGPGNVAGVNDRIFGEFPVNAVGAFSVQACTPDAADAGPSVFEVVFDQQAEFSVLVPQVRIFQMDVRVLEIKNRVVQNPFKGTIRAGRFCDTDFNGPSAKERDL